MRTMLAAGRVPATRWIFDCSPTDLKAVRGHHEKDAEILSRNYKPVFDSRYPYAPPETRWEGIPGDFWVILDADHYITIAVDPETGDAAWAVYEWGTDDCVDRSTGRVQDESVESVAFLAGRALGEALS
jgi:hypothetical protein